MTTSALPWDITRILFAVVAIGGLIIASLWVAMPFLPGAIWAVMIVIATWPEMRAVQRRLGGRRSLAVIVMTVIMLALILVPVGIAVATLIDRADEIAAWARALVGVSLPPPPEWLSNLPLVGPRLAGRWQNAASLRPDELAARINPYLGDIARWLLRQAGSLLVLFVELVLTLVFAAVLYARGEVAAAWVLAFARRLAGAEGERAARLSAQAIRAIALGIVVTALVQAVFGGLGLAITGVPHVAVLTALMFLLSVAQIGSGPVVFGAVIWLYWEQQVLWGSVMLVWAIVTSTMDNFLRPILIKKGADLPLLLVFVGVIGGLLAFGVVGLFIGPVVLAVSYTLLFAWIGEGRAATDD